MKILVVGGTGLIGGDAALLLRSQGHEVASPPANPRRAARAWRSSSSSAATTSPTACREPCSRDSTRSCSRPATTSATRHADSTTPRTGTASIPRACRDFSRSARGGRAPCHQRRQLLPAGGAAADREDPLRPFAQAGGRRCACAGHGGFPRHERQRALDRRRAARARSGFFRCTHALRRGHASSGACRSCPPAASTSCPRGRCRRRSPARSSAATRARRTSWATRT